MFNAGADVGLPDGVGILRPGWTDVDDAAWLKVAERPFVTKKIQAGRLKIERTITAPPAVIEHEHEPEPEEPALTDDDATPVALPSDLVVSEYAGKPKRGRRRKG